MRNFSHLKTIHLLTPLQGIRYGVNAQLLYSYFRGNSIIPIHSRVLKRVSVAKMYVPKGKRNENETVKTSLMLIFLYQT